MPSDLLLKNEPGFGLYDDFRMSTDYQFDPAEEVIPVAGPADNSVDSFVVVRAHMPQMRRVISFTAQRTGAPPRVPHPLTPELNGNDVLISAVVSEPIPMISGDGTTRVEVISGVYTYRTKRPLPPWVANSHRGGSPADTTPASANSLPASFFDHNLLAGT